MKVRIYKPHTHAGKRLAPGPDGIEIEVSEQDAKFLEERGLTKRPEVVADTPVPAKGLRSFIGGSEPQGS